MANKKTVEKYEVIHKDIDEIKMEVLNYAEEKIDREVETAVKRAEKKLIRHKNFVIIKRDILIIILIFIIGCLLYLMYQNNYFDKYFNNEENVTKVNNSITDINEEASLDDLKEKYSYLLDKINISEKSSYLSDYYDGNISGEILLSIAANNLDEESIILDDDTYIVTSSDIQNAFLEIFNTDYEPQSFTYNDITFKYLKTQEIYILDKEFTKSVSNIKRVVKDITQNDEEIIIETVEAIVSDKKVYNVETKKSVSTYKDDDTILSNEKKLNTIKYYFVKEDNNYLLKEIEAVK